MKSYVLTGIALYCLALFPTEARGEDIVKTTVCEVVANPPAFDHKLIELTGYATEGMENFSLSTKDCRIDKDNWTGIWLEYGGKRKSGAKYCCGVSMERTRVSDLTIEGVRTSLVNDARFRAFDARVYPTGEVKARLIGRYFAGTRQNLPARPELYFWGGYGHFGMGTLLVIQRVVSVEPRDKAGGSPVVKGDSHLER